MTVELTQLVQYLDYYLNSSQFKDYAPNGLQVEGKPQVNKLVTGVTASQALIEAAIEQQADAILVHHGYFWKNENPCIVGMKRNRLKLLLDNDISLIGYHLPLDVHNRVGNNTQLANRLGIIVDTTLNPNAPSIIGLQGHLPVAITVADFAQQVERVLGRKPQVVDNGRPVQKIGLCTGGGQGYIDEAIESGVDLYLTGEASEQTYHSAIENGISFIAAGHHATERFGVEALGNYLAKTFGLEHHFVDISNPF